LGPLHVGSHIIGPIDNINQPLADYDYRCDIEFSPDTPECIEAEGISYLNDKFRGVNLKICAQK
jgi:hypothetical protein